MKGTKYKIKLRLKSHADPIYILLGLKVGETYKCSVGVVDGKIEVKTSDKKVKYSSLTDFINAWDIVSRSAQKFKEWLYQKLYY